MLTCRMHDPTVASPVAVALPPAASNLNGPVFPVNLPNTRTTGPTFGSIPNASPLGDVRVNTKCLTTRKGKSHVGEIGGRDVLPFVVVVIAATARESQRPHAHEQG